MLSASDELIELREAESLKLSSGAVSIYRHILEKDDLLTEMDLAKGLILQSTSLCYLHRTEEGLEPCQEILGIARKLAIANLKLHGVFIAVLIGTVAHLMCLAQRQEGMNLWSEGVALLRRLVEEEEVEDKLRHKASLGFWLNMYSFALYENKEPQAALAPAQEAIAIFRQFDPEIDSGHRWLRAPLLVLGLSLSSCGRHPEAIQTAQESVSLSRQFGERDPLDYQDTFGLPTSLLLLARVLHRAGQYVDSVKPAQECLDIVRTMDVESEGIEAQLSRALHYLARNLASCGRFDTVKPLYLEAIERRRKLASERPKDSRIKALLAQSLHKYAIHLVETGENDRATEAIQESIDIYRRLIPENPKKYEGKVAKLEQLLASASANGTATTS